MNSRRALVAALPTPASVWQSLDWSSSAIVRSIRSRMDDDLTMGERILLQPWERTVLRRARPSKPYDVAQLCVALVDERRRRAYHREVEDGVEAFE